MCMCRKSHADDSIIIVAIAIVVDVLAVCAVNTPKIVHFLLVRGLDPF